MRSDTIVLSLLTEQPSEGQRDEGTFPGGKALSQAGRHSLQVAKPTSKSRHAELLPSPAPPLGIKVSDPVLQMRELRLDRVKPPGVGPQDHCPLPCTPAAAHTA